ncbi:MAG: hypothetical protein HDQ88_04845 [Clostridia bacterium]|nr:hypothetical protein [Clostridia bacterium]
MEAILTYSLISAELKKGMYVLVNNKLGYIKSITEEKVVVAYYDEVDNLLPLRNIEFTKDAIQPIQDSVLKLLAVVNNNPISINHGNYRKLLNPMLTFKAGSKESYITKFIETKEWIKPIVGEIRSIYSKLQPDDIVSIISIEDIDKYELYNIQERVAKVIKFLGEDKYEVQFGSTEKTGVVVRANMKKEEDDTFNVFDVMEFDTLKSLVESGKAKTIEAKGKAGKTTDKPKRVNPFTRVMQSDWKAVYDRLTEESEEPQWLAVNEKTNQRLTICIPTTNIPTHQFSGYDNNYWIPGTVKECENPTADMNRFVPFRENLPIFGSITTAELGGKQFTYFMLDNAKQEVVNRYIWANRDLTEERRSALTIAKLPTL